MNEVNFASLKAKKYSKISKIFLFLGISFLVTSIAIYIFADAIIKHQIHKNIFLQNGSRAFQYWLSPPATILRQYYFFDVRNPTAVSKGAKPVLVERGPYTYSEVWTKENIEFLDENRLHFSPIVALKFEPSLSAGNLTDQVTFLNIPAIAAAEKLKDNPSTINLFFQLTGSKLFLTKTVDQLMSGYSDSLIKMASVFERDKLKDGKFSLLLGKNATNWQNFTIMTGKDNVLNVGKILNWNGLEKLDFWDTDAANAINGTDGTFFPPFRTREEEIYSFNADMCRSYKLTYFKDNVIDGVKTFDFHLPPNIFANHTNNPDNFGFCPDGKCLGNGVLNISKCYGGLSGFISKPHFLDADKKFENAVGGMLPDINKHDFLIHFEPVK